MIVEILASASVGSVIGFGACAVLTAGKVADSAAVDEVIADRDSWKNAHADERDFWLGAAVTWDDERAVLNAAHARCADALGTTQRKLAKIRELTGGKETLRKGDVRAVLDGDV